MTNTFAEQSVLIVEKNLEQLEELRVMLSGYGFVDIQVASSVNMAVSVLTSTVIDVCFIAYDLGSREKNGLQVLQELHVAGRRQFSTCFVLVIDPERSELLFGSPENSPDGYISKPYDPVRIRSRIEKMLRAKSYLKPAEQLLDTGKLQESYECCDRIARQFPGLQGQLQRLKGMILLEKKDFAGALSLFEEMVRVQDKPWVRVAIGISSFHTGNYQRCRDEMQGVIDQQQVCVEAFTWMARLHWLMGERNQALTLLRKAVMLQPTVPLLQAELASMAAYSSEWRMAADGYRAAIEYARYSPFQRADYYMGYVRVLLKQIEESRGDNSALVADAIRMLELARHDFVDNLGIRFKSRLLVSELYRSKGEPRSSDLVASEAVRLFERLDLSMQAECMDLLVDGLERTTQDVVCKQHKQDVARQLTTMEWGRANMRGLMGFRSRELNEAFVQFKYAYSLVPDNIAVALNLLHAGLELLKSNADTDPEVLTSCAAVVTGLDFGALSSRQLQRYQTLAERFAQQLRPAEIA